MVDLARLAAPFPRASVHWRAQSVNRAKDKALALAYIDARDVMDRLDEVCGPDGWQSEFTETAKGRVICRLGILTAQGWVWKSDGAGDTDVEGEKGGISDALKRAAVAWGVGRYLYRLPTPWVPCEVGDNGKWRRWTADPWSQISQGREPEPPAQVAGGASAPTLNSAAMIYEISNCASGKELRATFSQFGVSEITAAAVESLRRIVKGAQAPAALDQMEKVFAPIWPAVAADAAARRDELTKAAA